MNKYKDITMEEIKYTAITIGPIIRTLQLARSTKAIWSASYLFSDIMKRIYKAVENEVGKENILLPKTQNPDKKQKAGLFPDRIIFKGKLNDFEKLKSDIIDSLAKQIADDLSESKEEVFNYLTNYLLIKKVEVDVEENKRIVKTMNDLLDTSELMLRTNEYANHNFLDTLFELYEKDKAVGYRYNTFINDEFGTKPFPPINRIATKGLNYEISDEYDDNEEAFYKEVKKQCGKDFRNYHKYMAIVQADGDNIGQFISSLTDPKIIQEVSACLFNFSAKAVEIIKDWQGKPIYADGVHRSFMSQNGGEPIYAGGDDLLFFAPVAKGKETIIDLIEKIDNVFKAEVINKVDKKLSMSYGINISYHKFPLDQALNNARLLLFEKAKKADNKDAIALRVTKHSGQIFETIYHKSGSIYTKAKSIFSDDFNNTNFISGFMYKLSPLEVIIENIGKIEDAEERNNRFHAFFENYFDEKLHKESLEQGFLRKVRDFMQEIYTPNPIFSNQEEKNRENIALLYATLRFYQFINAKPE